MKISGFDLYRYDLPLVTPTTLKGTTFYSREGLLLRLTAEDGSEGWGEAPPLPGFSRESLDKATRQLRELSCLLPGIALPADSPDADAFLPRSPVHPQLAPSARFALELAVWNLIAVPTDATVPTSSENRPKQTVPVNGLVSGSSTQALRDASRMARAGYRAVKLKVGGRPVSADVELVRDLKEVVRRDVELRLDANRAWGYEEAMEFGRGVADVGVGYVEEPLAEPGRLGELARGWGLPVALDETLVGMGPEELEEHGYARAVVLKPTLLGGLSRTLAFARRARLLGMRSVISASYESGVGTAGLVALAARIGDEPAGLDTYRRLAADVLQNPLNLPAPAIGVEEAVAAAREVDLERLKLIRRT